MHDMMRYVMAVVLTVCAYGVCPASDSDSSDSPALPDHITAPFFFGHDPDGAYYEAERNFIISKDKNGQPEVILRTWMLETCHECPRSYLLTTHHADGTLIDALPLGKCDNRIFSGHVSPLYRYLPDNVLDSVRYSVGTIPPAIEISAEGEWTVTSFDYHRFSYPDYEDRMTTVAANEISCGIDHDGYFTVSGIRPIPDDAGRFASMLSPSSGMSASTIRNICRRQLLRIRPYSKKITAGFLDGISCDNSSEDDLAYAVMLDPDTSVAIILSDINLLKRFASLPDEVISAISEAIQDNALKKRLTEALASVVL